MSPTDTAARAACEALAYAYGHHADSWEADQLADLFTPDGVFNRLGVKIAGRDAIRDFIANRPRTMWQVHEGSGFTFSLGPDGRSATGTLDLVLKRGMPGQPQASETLRARYHDQYAQTDAGWKFTLREVVLLESPA
jgi:hypothetical protein